MPSKMVQVAPNEMIRRNPGESDADVRKRWLAEQKKINDFLQQREKDRAFYARREKQDIAGKTEMDILRALGVDNFSKGGKASKRGKNPDSVVVKGMQKVRSK
jgi:hypothetical protein